MNPYDHRIPPKRLGMLGLSGFLMETGGRARCCVQTEVGRTCKYNTLRDAGAQRGRPRDVRPEDRTEILGELPAPTGRGPPNPTGREASVCYPLVPTPGVHKAE